MWNLLLLLLLLPLLLDGSWPWAHTTLIRLIAMYARTKEL